MRIAKADIDAYREALRDLGSQAAAYVTEAIGNVPTSRNEAGERAIEAITDTVGIHGEQAQALAAQLFDEVCELEGIDADAAVLFDDIIDEARLARKVHYFSRALVEGDGGRFVDGCSTLADYYAKRCAYENTVRNCAANNVRYARVPTGASTCPFCLMLASRGFVYHSEASAAAGMHMNCDCVVVPGRGGDDARSATQIEGYDPDLYYNLWQGQMSATAAERARRNGTSIATERMRMLDSLETAAKNAHARFKWKW